LVDVYFEVMFMNQDELLSLGDTLLKKVSNLGADDVELYIQKSEILDTRIITDYVTSRGGLDVGVGIRVSVGKKKGFFSVSSIDEDAVIEGTKMAIKIAKSRQEDPNFKHLPDPVRGYGSFKDFDEKLASLSSGELEKASFKVVDACFKGESSVKKVDFTLTRRIISYAILNTRGVSVGDTGTGIFAYCEVQLSPDKDNAKGLSVFVSRNWNEEKFYYLADEAVKMAKDSVGGRTLREPIEGQMLLANEAVTDFLPPLIFNISALNAQEGRSRFVGKIGEKVGWDKLTIVDDGRLKDGFRSSISDGEGMPTTTKRVIEGGVLKTFLYDTYTAYREGKESTGNGVRGGYSSEPSPSITNLMILETTSKGLEDLIQEVDKGVLVRGELLGSHLTDPLKGNISLTCLNAQYIEGGEIKYPLKAVSVTGNFFDMLNNIIAIGNDYYTSYLGLFPSMIIDKMSFA